MKEIWKEIDGYTGFYEISNMGRARSLDRVRSNGYGLYTQKGVILSGTINKSGYRVVYLTINGKGKMFYIHRLVASHFVENKDGLNIVHHKDHCKTNNRHTNLEFTTNRKNLDMAIAEERHCFGERVHFAKITEEKAKEIIDLLKTNSITATAKISEVPRTTVKDIYYRKSWVRNSKNIDFLPTKKRSKTI